MATRTIANGGGDWHTAGTWVEGAVPTAADAVVATGTSGNVTISADADCLTIVLTGYVGTLTHDAGVKLNIHSTATATVLSFPVGMTYVAAATSEIVVATSSSNERSLSAEGKTFGVLTYTVAGSTGVLSLGVGPKVFDTINVAGGRTLRLPGSNTLDRSLTTVTNWNVNGTAGSPVIVESSSSTFPAVLRASPSAYTFTDAIGNVLAPAIGPTSGAGTAVFMPGFLRLANGTVHLSGNLVTSDSPGLSVTGDIDIAMRLAMDDWTPGANRDLIQKGSSYGFRMNSTNFLRLVLGGTINAVADAAPTIADGDPLWVRVTWRNSDNRVQFFTAPDGDTPSWTQLGTDRSLSQTGISDSAAAVTIGGNTSGATLSADVLRAIIKDGIDGTEVLDADFTAEHAFIASDYITLENVQAAGLVDWYAEHATDLGGNLHWTFGAPPGPAGGWSLGLKFAA